MTDVSANSEIRGSLAQWLAGPHDWPLKDRLTLVERLARQVQTLHLNGQIHRAIGVDAVTFGEGARPQLSPPGPLRSFGGDDCDPEFCPPELSGAPGIVLPIDLDAARKALQEAGCTFDPRRIDVYQLGALLFRVVADESITSYIYDATIKSRLPALARPLVERTLGFDSLERFDTCEALITALDATLRKIEVYHAFPPSFYETPAMGSVIMPDNDTPSRGSQPAPAAAAASSASLPFETLGHFRILALIGSGGMGDVYRGYDESLHRPVAIKVLPAQFARDADFVRRFHAEATAAASVSHANVVPIYFIGEEQGHHFFVMQYVDGESLADRLRGRGRLGTDEALQVASQCLAGLQAAHARGLIHRDVKPGNVLIERETGRAMLVDFGLVRRLGEEARMTATGVVMGTVDYIAPEQARGQKVDARADIYSLGILLYQLLSGRLPFVADSPTAMVFQHAYEAPFPLDQAVASVPPPVVQIVARMMAKNPDDRYRDCGAALADIAAYSRGEPLAAATPSAKESEPPEDNASLPPLEAFMDAPPAELVDLLAPRRLHGVRDWAATMFRRHAPEFVQEMQGTVQQMDAAVAHYERRRNRLAKLLEEAGSLESELSPEELEELRRQLGVAETTLARLRAQQDLLKARLQAAEASRQMEAGVPRRKRIRWRVLARVGVAVVAAILLLVAMRLFIGWSRVSRVPTQFHVAPRQIGNVPDAGNQPANKPADNVAAATISVPFTIGSQSFKSGDSITITEVLATSPDPWIGDKIVVRGRYALASEPKASLSLYITSAQAVAGSTDRPEQTIAITRRQGAFHLAKTLDYEGEPHVSFYPSSGGAGFGGIYFGFSRFKPANHAAAEKNAVASGIGIRCEDGAAAAVTLELKENAHSTVIRSWQTRAPGTLTLNPSDVAPDSYKLFVSANGYASQWVSLRVSHNAISPMSQTVTLYRKRYVVFRYACNHDGSRDLSSGKTQQGYVAVSHWGQVPQLRGDWQIWQKGANLSFELHRYSTNFGFAKAPAGSTFDALTTAPENDQYVSQNLWAAPGQIFFTRVAGNTPGEQCYAKVFVEEITERPPAGAEVIEGRQ
jgi:serine/threonine protein kinase